MENYTEYKNVPWYKRSIPSWILLVLGAPFSLVTSTMLLKGDIYTKVKDEDGNLIIWGKTKRVIAYIWTILGLIYILAIAVSFMNLNINNLFVSTPKCSSDEVKTLVQDIYSNMINNNDNILLQAYMAKAPKYIDSLNSIRTVSFDENVNLRECKAVANFENGSSADIEYSVQISDNNEEFYVELKKDFLQQIMMQSIMSK